jgi:hypothetical protein
MKGPPSISLPQGVRDILPEEAEKICEVESAILGVFSSYGFKRVITPLLEYVDVLGLGMGPGLKEKVFKFIDPPDSTDGGYTDEGLPSSAEALLQRERLAQPRTQGWKNQGNPSDRGRVYLQGAFF